MGLGAGGGRRACVASSTSRGTKSGVHPCSRCGRKTGCDSLVIEPSSSYVVLTPLSSSGALLGSHSTMRVPGRLSRSVCPTPSSVPPVPYAVTKQSSCRPSKARTISGPVVWRWIHAFASLSN